MDVEHFRKLLVAKEKELTADLARTGKDKPDQDAPEVQDAMDRVIASEAKDTQMNQASYEAQLLREVRDALRRIEEGTYGECEACGEPIEPKRLEAVPWAQYDLKHQEEYDRENQVRTGGATL